MTVTITDLNNAKTDVDHISEVATSLSPTATDRLGHVKPTVAAAVATIAAFNNRGAWSGPGSAYAVKDLVLQAGTWYVCVVAHTSSAAFATDAANWRVYQGVVEADLRLATYAALRAYVGSATGIHITGYLATAASTIGGLFVRDDSDTTSTDNGGTVVVDALGRRWKRSFDGDVNVLWFGADPTGTSDSKSAIQSAIDYVVLSGGRRCVYAPAGRYRTTDTIHLGYGTTFTSVVFRGDGYAYRGSLNFSGTTIVADFNDRPAINFQGARGSILRGMAVLGKNFDWIINRDLGGPAPTLDDTVLSNWIDSTFPAASSSRFAPYAGVTVDAYSGVAPATAYPAVTYPASLGAVAQYGKSFSSGVLIDDCWIGGFVAGVVNQPCDADGSGDFTKVRRCLIEANVYALSVGNAQSRNVGVEECTIGFFHTAFTNSVHGKRTGKFGGVFSNTSFFRGLNLIDFDAAFAGPVTWLNCYAESLWKIGRYGTGTVLTNHPMKFVGCEFFFSGQTDARGVPATILDSGTPAPIDFQSTELWGFPSVIVVNAPTGDMHVTNVKLRTTNTRPNTYEKLAHNMLAGGLMFPVTATKNRPAQFSAVSTARYNVDTGAVGGEVISEVCPTQRINPVCAWSRRASPFNQPEFSASTPLLWDSLSKASFSSITLVGKTLTLVITPARTEATFAKKGPFPGDVIFDDDSKSVFFVRSTDVATKTVIAELQNNYKLVGGVYTPVTAFSTVTGNLYFGNSRVYLPTWFLRGDTSTASAQITNAGRDDGFATWIDTEILVGDFLYINDLVDRFVSPANVKVAARSGAGGTIDLSGNAARTLTTKALGFFIRQPPPNV